MGVLPSTNIANVNLGLIKLNVDMTRQVEVYKYFGYGDIVSKLGGLKAAISPVLFGASSIFMLAFLYRLSGIIKNKYKEELIANYI